MIEKRKTKEMIKTIWMKDGIWRFSAFIREFRHRALRKFPKVDWTSKAKEPQDKNTIAQNLIYLFPSHLLKISKALSSILSDEESMDFLSSSKELVIIDLACGPGTAGIGVLDFILQLVLKGIIIRKTPLKISVILNDIQPNCTKAAKSNYYLLKEMLPEYSSNIQIEKVEICNASITEVLSYYKSKKSNQKFNLMVMAHPFDPILYHAEKVLEIDPDCKDPIVHARPCDRPGILGDFYMKLGAFSDPYFSRALLVQENRYSPLLPICIPSRDLKVIRTNMEQVAIRPDCIKKTMKVPFAYCAFKYAYKKNTCSRYPVPQPLPHLEGMLNCFDEDFQDEI
jgi:hypothetical protein